VITEPSRPAVASVASGASGAAPRERRITRAATALARRHWMLVILLTAGVGLRVITQIAYRPALFYIDSWKYLTGSGGIDPEGYRFLMAPVLWAGNLAVVPALQHLLGLAMGLAIYTVLIRRGAPRWAGALAAAPILLDAYQLQMEQTIMPDVVFEAFIVAGLTILLWTPRPSLKRLVAGALVLGLATDVRQIGELLIIPAAVFAVLVARGDWRRRARWLVVGLVSCAIPMLVYMTVSAASGAGFTLAAHRTNVLYGRAADAANCSTLKLPADEQALCPTPAQKAAGIDGIINDTNGSYQMFQPPPGKSTAAMSGNFVLRVAKQQPLAIPLSALRDAARLFTLTKDGTTSITAISRWQFQPTYATYPPGVTLGFVAEQGQRYGGGGPVTIRPLATFLRAYQLDGGYTPGPLLAVLAAAGLAGWLFVFTRRRKDPRPVNPSGAIPDPPRTGPEARTSQAARTSQDIQLMAAGTALATLTAVCVVLGSDVYEFSWRYQLPALVTLPLAGVLGGTLIAARLRARRDRTTTSPARAAAPQDRPAAPQACTAAPQDRRAAPQQRPAARRERTPARHRQTGNQGRRAISTTAGPRGEESHQDKRAG
jgi:hypothetical protein